MTKHQYNKQGWNRRKQSHRKGSFLERFGIQGLNMKNLVLLGIIILFAGSIALLGFIAIISRDLPNPDSLTERTISQTTKIYDRTGEHVLYEIFGDENRTLKKMQTGFCGDGSELELDETGIPLFVAQATISAEDHSFCQHSGLDFKGLARAILQNLMGNRVGGSTLTQQLVKNAILSSEKTLTRKVKELIISLELERRYTKDELLQIYLNEIPYGSTYYGIEAATQNYFHTSVNELTLAQAATLAAIPKATTYYLNNPDRLQARRDYILGEMLDLGFITQDEHDQAILELTPVEVNLSNIDAPHFVLYVKEQLEDTYGRSAVEQGGLKVVTTLDFDMQMIAEEEVLKGVDENKERYGLTNSALVAIDPKTGQILSMVGSKNFFDEEIDGQVNVTTRLRQPGSSFKPIVYAKGFEMGYTPNTVLWDVVTTFPTVTGNYTPHNYDLGELGPIRVRDALQRSLNISAVKMMYLVGIENALDFATSLGYTSFDDHSAFGLSLVLGGGEVQLLEHTNAYATFANDGVRNDIASILRVEDADGTILDEWKERGGKKILDPNIARILTNVLKDNDARTPVFGAGSYLQLGDRPVAAKTGTTNDYRDGWLMGYTPSLAVGVWVGNNDNTAMNRAGGSIGAGPIWNGFMKRALANTPIEYFPSPTIEATGKAVLDGDIASTTVMVDRASGKLATEYTPDSYKEERTYAQYHSILHYVDRADPTGSEPKNPDEDGMYAPWEAAIQTWIQKKQEETGIEILNEAPPTDEDDLHVPKNFPSVKITSPSKNENLADRTLSVSVNTDAPRGVNRTEFYIDGQYLGSDASSPFSLSTSIPSSIGRGVHTLKVIAYDDIDNTGSDTVSFQLNADAGSESLELIDPKNGQTIERTNETYTIVVSLKNPEDYSSVTVYAEDLSTGSVTVAGQVLDPTSPFLTFDWALPASGTWALSARSVSDDGATELSTTGVLVEIVPSGTTEEAPPEDTSTPEDTPIIDENIFTPESDLNLFGP
ncbi:transglycosylase domain-containing protein [Candidatus Uhrbacteria bacterium]|nr:transglycosylase domain-containing protein [Candidatus Uhrbacteria bacterium]